MYIYIFHSGLVFHLKMNIWWLHLTFSFRMIITVESKDVQGENTAEWITAERWR